MVVITQSPARVVVREFREAEMDEVIQLALVALFPEANDDNTSRHDRVQEEEA